MNPAVWITLIAIVGLLLIVIVSVISMYNKLVSARLKVETQFSQIDVQLQKRADLIPNVVETVKGYASHEKETLSGLVEARTKYMSASTPEGRLEASQEMSGGLGRLFAVAEAYPDLKANTNFLDLQRQLADIEEKIAKYRQFYNDTVMMYHRLREIFPSSIVASLFHFAPKTFFEAEQESKAVPKVSF